MTPTPAAVCGDGTRSGTEQCDDGNTLPGDCCSPECRMDPANVPCNDRNTRTCQDVCSAEGVCAGVPRGPCEAGDGCCPRGCMASTDRDCEQVDYGSEQRNQVTSQGGAAGSGNLNGGPAGSGAGGGTANGVDLILGDGASEEVVVLEGDGQGNFTRAGSVGGAATGDGGGAGSSAGVVDLALADVDGDGNLDVVTALGSAELSALLGDGTLALAQGPRSPLASTPLRLELTELDADARPDAVVGTIAGLELLRNTGSGAFTRLALLDSGAPVSDVAVTRAGIVAALPEEDEVKVYRRVDETIEVVAALDVEEPRAVAAADFTGDGIEDLAVASGAGFVAVHPGRAEGGFDSPLNERVTGVMLRRLWPADLNGNGLADLVGLEQDDPALQLLFGRGDGTFELQIGPAGTEPAAGVVVADLNGDRFPDLVLSGEEITIGIAESSGPPIVPGDASGDGELTPADVDQLIAEIFDGDGDNALSCGAPPILSAAGADANDDGVIGAADLNQSLAIGGP